MWGGENIFHFYSSCSWGWIWTENLNVVPSTCALEFGPFQRNLKLAALGAMLERSFFPVVQLWLPGWAGSSLDHLQGNSVKIASCYGQYNLNTKRMDLYPWRQRLNVCLLLSAFICVSDVRPVERCRFIKAAAVRCSHWGTSEELTSRRKEST